jgi:hypothetical protein
VVPVARGQVLVLAQVSAQAPLEAPVGQQAGPVARVPSVVPAPARFPVAPTRPTALPPRAALPTGEPQARVRRREAVGAQVVGPEEALEDAAAGAARAGVGARALTEKSYKPRRRRRMWRRMPPYPRAKSSWNGVQRPKSWRRA